MADSLTQQTVTRPGVYAPYVSNVQDATLDSKEGSIEIGAPNPYTYYRLTAQTDSPVFPAVSIRWAVLGRRR